MREWDQFLTQLEGSLGRNAVEEWLRPLRVVRFDAGNLYLEAENSFQTAWFEEHIRPLLKGWTNNNQRPIKVHLNAAAAPKKLEKKEPLPLAILPSRLDPEMALAHFAPGGDSLIAYQLLSEAASSPFNPIYLYGPKGAGKTHLLMGAAQALQQAGKKVFFVRAESFTEHVVQAIRMGLMQEFRKVYRDIDALIVDDIHIFSRKNATQEEFFHTFNTLHTLGRPIILSANVPPSQLIEIEPRLISRFEWGISLGLSKPDAKAVLTKKASLWNMPLTEELLHFLETRFPSNPVLALQALHFRFQGKIAPTPLIAEKILVDLLEKEKADALTPEKIVKGIASHYGIKSEDLLGKSQTREFALPRQVAMYVCRERLQMPYQKIGELFGRDHSTVMSSVKAIQKGIEEKKGDLIEATHSIAPG